MRLLSSFKHFYYSFDIAVRFLLFLSVSVFSESAHICKNSADLHLSAKILQITDSQRSKTWEANHLLINLDEFSRNTVFLKIGCDQDHSLHLHSFYMCISLSSLRCLLRFALFEPSSFSTRWFLRSLRTLCLF